MIANPLADGGLSGLFRTHPATADRIRRLHHLAAQHLPRRPLIRR